MFVFWFLIVYLPKKIETKIWPKAAESPLPILIRVAHDSIIFYKVRNSKKKKYLGLLSVNGLKTLKLKYTFVLIANYEALQQNLYK